MSAASSPTTPKAVPAMPAEPVASPSSPSPIADTLDRMEHYKNRQPPPDLADRFASARGLTPIKAPSPTPPRSSYELEARSRLAGVSPLPPPSFGAYGFPEVPVATASPLVPNAASHPTAGGVYAAHDGSLVRSDAGSRVWSVPGNYRNRNDHNMVHRGPAGGMRAVMQQYSALAATQDRYTPTPQHVAPTISAPAPTRDVSLTAAATCPADPVDQVQAVVPPLGVDPTTSRASRTLKMVRSHCVAKIDLLRPVLTWLDMHMGEELRTPAFTDPMISNIVYAVKVPMIDQHWYDWNKVVTVFPRAAAWQEALTPPEPFDQITAGHPTALMLVEGESL